jgi:colicin import membrane protein
VIQAMVDLPPFSRIRYEPGKRAAWVMAVAVHLLLAMFLIYGVRWQVSAPETVSVDLVRYVPPSNTDKPAAPPQAQKPPERPEPVPQTKPAAEPPAAPKADILRKEPEKPKTIKETATQSLDAITKLLQSETARMLSHRNEDAAERAAEHELAQLKSSQAASARNKGLADYQAKIIGKIRGNIVLPPAINGNPESIFVVTQLPSGEVLSVKLQTPSGNQALDTAIERAILKSSPLPKPDDPNLFQREISIKYRPLED